MDQVLPRPRHGSDPFLVGEGAFLVATEEYTSTLHEVQIGSMGSQPEFGYIAKPLVDRNVVLRLRPNLGSLLYFGLYNMLNSSKLIRIRSFLLLKELFTVFNPDKQLDVNAYFAKFTGSFYSNVGLNLKTKLLNMSLLAADLFPSEAPGFLWEAVRCCRTILKAEKPLCLVSPQRWILELLKPWCRYIDLNTIKENLVNAEVFKFLMDSAFTANTHMETVQSCWIEVANSQVYGLQNTKILTDALMQVCGKVDRLRDQGLTLAAGIYSIHPSIVASTLCMQLSSSAFPWKLSTIQRLSSNTNSIINDYVHSLYQTVHGTTFDSSNDYPIFCKSAVMMISELVPQDCSPIIPFLPVLLNYIVLHLPSKLQESSVSTFLLANLLEGYIGMLHVSGKVKNPAFGSCVEKIRKLLTHFELPACFVDFEEQKM
jgi:hypothetical protein